MEIRLAKEGQLLEVLYIIRECAQQLKDKGVRHWHNSHLDYEEISGDIKNSYVYILFEKFVAVGTITIKPDNDSKEVCHIDRLAIFPHFQRRGYAKSMIDFTEAEARNKKYTTIRGIIPLEDESLCKLLGEKGFINKGHVAHSPGDIAKIMFEKILA